MKWNQSEFAHRLKTALARKNLNEKKLAEILGISPSTVGRWQTSPTNVPSLDTLARVGEALGVRPAWLAFGDTAITEQQGILGEAFELLTDAQRDAVVQTLGSMIVPNGVKLDETAITFKELLDEARPIVEGFPKHIRAHARVLIVRLLQERRKNLGQPQLDIEVNHDAGITALSMKISDAVERHTRSETQSPSPRLTPEEGRAFLTWMNREAQKWKVEMPVTRALRKIAMQLAHDIDVPKTQEDQGKVPASQEIHGKATATSKAPAERAVRRKSHGSS